MCNSKHPHIHLFSCLQLTNAYVEQVQRSSTQTFSEVQHILKRVCAALWKMQKRFDLVMYYPLSQHDNLTFNKLLLQWKLIRSLVRDREWGLIREHFHCQVCTTDESNLERFVWAFCLLKSSNIIKFSQHTAER